MALGLARDVSEIQRNRFAATFSACLAELQLLGAAQGRLNVRNEGAFPPMACLTDRQISGRELRHRKTDEKAGKSSAK
mgnify:FL=1